MKMETTQNHVLVLQYLKKVISRIKIYYCNNPKLELPFSTHESPYYNIRKLSVQKISLQHGETTKGVQTTRGCVRGAGCSNPCPITFELVGGRRE
jgi:hypothetical protein